MTSSASGVKILSFDSRRVRPGLREMMLQADEILTESVENDRWKQDRKATPDLLRGFIPSEGDLFRTDDRLLCESALKLSTLALHAIDSEAWAGQDHRAFFLGIQAHVQDLSSRIAALPARLAG